MRDAISPKPRAVNLDPMFPALFLAASLTLSADREPVVREMSIRTAPSRNDTIDLPTLPPLPSDSGIPAPRLWVITLLATECPLSRQHVYTLNRLRADFQHRSIAFVGLFPRLASTSEELAGFRAETGAGFALAGDSALLWTRRLGGIMTPEVFVVRKDGVIVYSGALDDWAVSLGRRRRAATRHYVREALEATHAKHLPQTRRVEPVGCRIE